MENLFEQEVNIPNTQSPHMIIKIWNVQQKKRLLEWKIQNCLEHKNKQIEELIHAKQNVDLEHNCKMIELEKKFKIKLKEFGKKMSYNTDDEFFKLQNEFEEVKKYNKNLILENEFLKKGILEMKSKIFELKSPRDMKQ